MPTLTRLLSIVGMAVVAIVLCMYALATFVEPNPRTYTVQVMESGLK
ncbi:hypothetical protein [Polycladidibacter hongkongensis]|nr:hypothetical protein [Pseudovibrio hongkongensis]